MVSDRGIGPDETNPGLVSAAIQAITQHIRVEGLGPGDLLPSEADMTFLPDDGVFLGRARSADVPHPLVVTVRDATVFDITSIAAPTVRDICEMADPAGHDLLSFPKNPRPPLD